ncbi:MAG TPA: hypothetical protein ENJ79_11120 [Gammaproteobacteria bacterium]|nr:hypothetical protein [Gammaproteobacteria bacterium]
MSNRILAELVAQTLATGRPQTLSEEKRHAFHRAFEADISDEVERMRARKRQAWEKLRQIAIR